MACKGPSSLVASVTETQSPIIPSWFSVCPLRTPWIEVWLRSSKKTDYHLVINTIAKSVIVSPVPQSRMSCATYLSTWSSTLKGSPTRRWRKLVKTRPITHSSTCQSKHLAFILTLYIGIVHKNRMSNTSCLLWQCTKDKQIAATMWHTQRGITDGTCSTMKRSSLWAKVGL